MGRTTEFCPASTANIAVASARHSPRDRTFVAAQRRPRPQLGPRARRGDDRPCPLRVRPDVRGASCQCANRVDERRGRGSGTRHSARRTDRDRPAARRAERFLAGAVSSKAAPGTTTSANPRESRGYGSLPLTAHPRASRARCTFPPNRPGLGPSHLRGGNLRLHRRCLRRSRLRRLPPPRRRASVPGELEQPSVPARIAVRLP